ncbi:hypothetical protein [Haloparvum sedimenti]|uniref:hypothetical protein n=1 Tax=Haloparvum sedimenti TaxID=1678448 RepID=UPI00071E8116|nr:hypothetical protein [Haloparvum sedimenti]
MREILTHTIIIAVFGALLYASAVSVYTANTGKILLFGYLLLTPRLFEFLGAVRERNSGAPQKEIA